MDWESHLEKKSIQKVEKTVKIKAKLSRVKKTLTRKRFFAQTQFFHLSTLKLDQIFNNTAPPI